MSAQPGSGRHSGTWVLTGQYYASGAPLPPTANLNVNDTRLIVNGEDSGTFTIDEPMRFADNSGHLSISCRGTVTGSFTVSHIAGFSVLHQTNAVETIGPACRQMAGQTTKQSNLQVIFEISGDNMRVVNGLKDEDSPTKTPDMAIYTYKRINPTSR